MRDTTLHFCWKFVLRATPAQFWPYIADTNRLNASVGQPMLEGVPEHRTKREDGRMLLRFSVLGVPVTWEEEPFEWVYPQRYGVTRRYSQGPMRLMQVRIALEPRAEGGSILHYHVHATTRGLLGHISLPVYIGIIMARRIGRLVASYDELATDPAVPLPSATHVTFAPAGRQRLHRLSEELLAAGVPADLLDRLVAALSELDEFTVSQLRPYQLADMWGVERRAVLEMFLRATSVGLLNFQWDLLCPLCRNTNGQNEHLSDVNPQVHCESCNIDYTVNFDRSVELTFFPNPAIRPVEHHEFCVGGPHRTPHIVVQQIVPADTRRTIALALEPGRYRLRTQGYPGGQPLAVVSGGAAEHTFLPDPASAPNEEVLLTSAARLHLHNNTCAEQIFMLERTAWSDQAVTAAEVTALQLFRSLFSSEALRPGERIAVGSITLVFTDLRGSTRLYREIGDAPAFGRVMSHFDVLIGAVADEGGAVVKTIGDAVMAVFPRPLNALRAMLDAQRALADPPDGLLPLHLKVGMHSGPCITVTLNERLDYFGSTVNIAARLEGLSSGQDVVLTPEVLTDPGVQEWLAEQGDALTCTSFQQQLKGFASVGDFELWRVAHTAELPAPVTEAPAQAPS